MTKAVWRISGTALLLTLPELEIERTVWIDFVSKDQMTFRTQHPFELADDIVLIRYRNPSRSLNDAVREGPNQVIYEAMERLALMIIAALRGTGSRLTINLAGNNVRMHQHQNGDLEFSVLRVPQLRVRVARDPSERKEPVHTSDLRSVWFAHLADTIWTAMKIPIQTELALTG